MGEDYGKQFEIGDYTIVDVIEEKEQFAERWQGFILLWQLRRLSRQIGLSGQTRSGYWALAILMAANREMSLTWSKRRDGGWIKVSSALLPGIEMPRHRRTRAASLELLKRAGLIEVKRQKPGASAYIRVRPLAEVKGGKPSS